MSPTGKALDGYRRTTHFTDSLELGNRRMVVARRLGANSLGVASMCDYSLHNVASRPARVGDKLVSTRFLNSGRRGFAAVGERY